MPNLETIDSSALLSIHGGNRPPARAPVAPVHPTPHPSPAPASAQNRTQVSTNIGVATAPVRVGVQVDVDRQRSNYAACLDLAERMHATPSQILQMCATPPAG